MKRDETELVIDPRIAQWTVQAFARLLATYAIVNGVHIILSGASRFSAISYETAMRVPGAPTSWGVILVIAGVIALFGTLTFRPSVACVGLWIGGVWSMFFAVTFIASFFKHPGGNPTGMWAYGLLCCLFYIASAAYKMAVAPVRSATGSPSHDHGDATRNTAPRAPRADGA